MTIPRETLISINGNTTVDQAQFRSVKTEFLNRENDDIYSTMTDHFQETPKRPRSARSHGGSHEKEPVQQSTADHRLLRTHYLAVQNIINVEKEEICRGGSDMFQRMMKEVDDLHKYVTKPREQVTDAETLLDMANTLVTTVKAYSKDGLTPSAFISSLLRDFSNGGSRLDDEHVSIKWDAIGVRVCPIFKKAQGCATMIGPMSVQLKRKRPYARKNRTKLAVAAKPQEIEDSGADYKKDTAKNMFTMFNILRNKKSVKLENLILNRISFAQTVENLFALSFLVKDGRAHIAVNDEGTHLVSPRNAPNAESISTGEVLYHHFVFRFDFKDWKLMADSVGVGEVHMPHRYVSMPLTQEEVVTDLTPVGIPIFANDGRSK
ncbi:unnamed protein product [Amaranthus hypochondriacus]